MAPRSSMVPPAIVGIQRSSRVSTIGTTAAAARAPAAAPQRPANRLSTLRKNTNGKSDAASVSTQSSAPNDLPSPHESEEAEGIPTPTSDQGARIEAPLSPPVSQPVEAILSPPLFQASAPTQPLVTRPPLNHRPRVSSISQRGTGSAAANNKKVEELEVKIRVLEKKRIEDRERIKMLGKTEEDRDKYKSIIQKLEAKLQPQQQELTELRRRVKEAEASADASESQALDIDTAVEMATLDREMAEEKAEALQAELNTIKARLEELELEVEVLRDENEEFSKDVDPEEKAAHGWIHLEKENERLREALMRLRDMTQDSEDNMKSTVQSLEREVDELRAYRDMFEETQRKLNDSEADVETLRENLEAALGADEMIEELTDRNQSLIERMDGMKTEIEDLEDLKELNEEIELAHADTEKQLQDEIDYQEALYLDQVRQNEAKNESIQDLEYTVTRFRDLVSTLQMDLHEMQASQQLSETEASELANRTRAMMDLNNHLQSTASKTQVKAIDLELQRLQVQEATQHLAIIQPFLPEGYSAARESINALLRLKRVGFKANMVHAFIKERLGGVAVPGREDDMFYACEMLVKLTWINATSERFSVFVESCSLESFRKLGGALYDLEPVERGFNAWIEALKKDTLREKLCSSELDRSIAIMEHLAEIHVSESLRDYAQDVYMRARLMQSNFDSAIYAATHIKAISQARVLLPVEADEDVEQEAQDFLQKADAFVAQLRSAKVTAEKSIQQLDELASRSLTLDEPTLSSIEQYQNSSKELLAACLASGMSTAAVANEEGREDDLAYRDIIKAIGSGDSTPFSSLYSKAQIASKQIQDFYSLTSSIKQAVEFPSNVSQAPWNTVAQQVKDHVSVLQQSVLDLSHARDEIVEKNTALILKDKAMEEMSVTVEVLKKRVGESGGKREKLKELETTISKLENSEHALTKRLVEAEAKLHTAEMEKETLKSQAAVAGTKPAPDQIDENLRQQVLATNFVLEENVKSLVIMVKNLRGSIQSSRTDTSAAVQKVAATIASVPVTPRKQVTKQNLLGAEAARLYKDSPAPKVEWELRVKEQEQALAWRAEKEKVRCPLQVLEGNIGAWQEYRDEVYGDWKYVVRPAKKEKKGNGRHFGGKQMMDPMGTMNPWDMLQGAQTPYVLMR